MIDEYKKTEHFKKKLENYKINKIMGRIKKKAKGPNPLSCKKKKSLIENKNDKFPSDNKKEESKNKNFELVDGINKDLNALDKINDTQTDNQEFLKKKRKRKRKNKNQ